MTVQTIADIYDDSLKELLERYNMLLSQVEPDREIPGSHWGDSEAGLIENRLYVREDTPVHSALHETCHYICMDQSRRTDLHTDAGGDYDEENGVCYLQILLADYISGNSQPDMMKEMDQWGYSFRLGSAQAWFEQDAAETRDWLLEKNLISNDNEPTWRLRQ